MKNDNNFRNNGNYHPRGNYNRSNGNNRRNNGNYEGRGYNRRNSGYKNPNNPFVKIQKEQNDKKKQAIYEGQVARLELLSAAATFLDEALRKDDNGNTANINYMSGIFQFLAENGYTDEEVRHNMNQLRPLVDLAWAQKKCTFMTPERIKIRVDYIREVYKTMCMRSLHYKVDDIINTCPILFHIGEDETVENDHEVVNDNTIVEETGNG